MSDTYSRYQKHKTGRLTPTGKDIVGPFYLPNSPVRRELTANPTLVLTGRVLDSVGKPVKGVMLDFWQANEHGQYDEHGHKFRGRQFLGDTGEYSFGTVKPGYYKISEPGQPEEFRCAHIHVKVWVDGVERLTTQLYFANEPYDNTDHWFSQDRCVTWTTRNQDQARFDFVLEGSYSTDVDTVV